MTDMRSNAMVTAPSTVPKFSRNPFMHRLTDSGGPQRRFKIPLVLYRVIVCGPSKQMRIAASWLLKWRRGASPARDGHDRRTRRSDLTFVIRVADFEDRPTFVNATCHGHRSPAMTGSVHER